MRLGDYQNSWTRSEVNFCCWIATFFHHQCLIASPVHKTWTVRGFKSSLKVSPRKIECNMHVNSAYHNSDLIYVHRYRITAWMLSRWVDTPPYISSHYPHLGSQGFFNQSTNTSCRIPVFFLKTSSLKNTSILVQGQMCIGEHLSLQTPSKLGQTSAKPLPEHINTSSRIDGHRWTSVVRLCYLDEQRDKCCI